MSKIKADMDTLFKMVKNKDANRQEEALAIVNIQKVFRGFSVRIYFEERGVKFVPGIPTVESREIAAERVRVDFANRRLFERRGQISRLEEGKGEMRERTTTEVQWAVGEIGRYEGISGGYGARLERLHLTENELRDELALLDVKSREYYEKAVEMKVVKAKKEHCFGNQEIVDTGVSRTTVCCAGKENPLFLGFLLYSPCSIVN